MHELGITRNIVAIVQEHAQGSPVKRVSLEIGKLSAVMPDAIRFCFDVCAKDTELAGADLEIIETPGFFRCRDCLTENEFDNYFSKCSCGSYNLACVAGEELKIKEMEYV
jgi:hydrogenase nickel incorporation protein HypA/HybF